jgi:hypothetical protein
VTLPPWQPYREPLWTTLARTGAIALVAGFVVARGLGGSLRYWPLATLLMLWPSLGGHFVELLYLNWLRPRIAASRGVQIGARPIVWFVGGILLGIGMALTAMPAARQFAISVSRWWVAAGFAFIGIELVAQLALQLRGRPSFCTGRG